MVATARKVKYPHKADRALPLKLVQWWCRNSDRSCIGCSIGGVEHEDAHGNRVIPLAQGPLSVHVNVDADPETGDRRVGIVASAMLGSLRATTYRGRAIALPNSESTSGAELLVRTGIGHRIVLIEHKICSLGRW
jgi:hypothetical protein